MSTDRWRQIEEVFQTAVELSPAEQAAYLDEGCGDDLELLNEVQSLLRADREAQGFLREQTRASADEPDATGGGIEIPREIGSYRPLRRISTGGMGTVYLAARIDDEYQQEVAIKVFALGPERRDLIRRFRAERQILASLDHPSIARLIDGGTTQGGLPYIVMEYIDGEPIDTYCDSKRLSIEDRIELFGQLSSAVHYAHQNLVVHRDIKPSNVLVTRDGVPKLLDFGIAKLIAPELFPQTVQQTVTGQRLLTPRFASPEQVRGEAVTTASDVYSMGVLLYYLLTGRLPYAVSREGEIEHAVLEEDAQRPSAAVLRVERLDAVSSVKLAATPQQVAEARGTQPERLRRRLSGDLDNIVLKAVRKEPERRYSSIEPFQQDLRRHRAGLPVLARPDTLGYRASKFIGRHRFGTATATIGALLLVGFAALMSAQASRVAHQRDQARLERDKAARVVSFVERIFEVSDPREGRGEAISARELLDRGAGTITAELEDEPEVMAALTLTIGNVYRSLGIYEEAEPLLQRSLATRRRLLGPESSGVADSSTGLARLLRDKGDLRGAEELFRQALEVRRRLPEGRDAAVAESLNDLGVVRRELGDYEEAAALLLDALELRRSQPNPNAALLAQALADLGEVYAHLDDLPRAEELSREALETARELFGEVHPQVAEYMNTLGVMLGMQGKHQAAAELLTKVLDSRRKLYGQEHPAVAESLNNLGMLHRELGDREAALGYYLESLEVFRASSGARIPPVVLLLQNCGLLLIEAGEPERAEGYFREALSIGREVLDENHWYIGSILVGLGRIELGRGDAAAAEPFLRQGLEILRTALPADHYRIAIAESSLAGGLAGLRRFQEAEALALGAYDRLAAKLGSDNRFTLVALDRVIELYDAWGQGEKVAVFRAKRPHAEGADP